MKKQVVLYFIATGIMSLLVTSCAQKKDDKPDEYNNVEKKRGCGCSSENILDLRASECPSEGLANPSARL